ncbi:MAG: VWA domain-containing protein [Bacilli bacterium]|nr:VWA domain-containing protein [Bacilli bacterium]
MAIKYPIIFISFPILITIYLFHAKKKREKNPDSKIANTKFLKETYYYKKLIRKYNFYKRLIYFSFIVAIISSIILCSRLQEVKTRNVNEYKRDIILCMDVSTSVDELNMKLIKNLKKTVKSLEGERFGISIFNTTSVLVSPLTDDYEYINTVLDEIERSIKLNNNSSYNIDDDYYYISNYVYSGTIEGNEIRGSSLIGDGLASCVFSFPNLEEDRTRLIIFSTDNELQGTPTLSLENAAKISKNKNIKVYGIGTTKMYDKLELEMKNAVELTGGKYYKESDSTVNKIVSNIEKTSKSLIDTRIETTETDLPTIPLILLLLSITTIILCRKKVVE